MVIRVLPLVGKSARRLPLEKSYSALIILYLFRSCAANRSQPYPIITNFINNHQDAPGVSHSNSNEALFTLDIGVFPMYGNRVKKHPLHIRKRHVLFFETACRLLRIELKAHDHESYV